MNTRARTKSLIICPGVLHTKGAIMQTKEMTTESKRAAALWEIRKVLPLIDFIKQEKRGTNWSGTETCPICQQLILIHHFRESGKTWGRCSTKNCVAWMCSLMLGILNVSFYLAVEPYS